MSISETEQTDQTYETKTQIYPSGCIIYCSNPLTVLNLKPTESQLTQKEQLLNHTDPSDEVAITHPYLLIRYPNDTATSIIAGGLPEQSLIEWCGQFLRSGQDFVDIGAHVGMYALSLAPRCAKVHAFECQRENFFQLCGGIALNALWNVYPHHVALGELNANQPQPVYVVSPDGGGTTLIKPKDISSIQYVQQRTLDSYGLNSVCFLKLDAEQSEESILRGSVETLKRSHWPPFMFESWDGDEHRVQRDSLHAFISQALGYTILPIRCYSYMFLAVKAS